MFADAACGGSGTAAARAVEKRGRGRGWLSRLCLLSADQRPTFRPPGPPGHPYGPQDRADRPPRARGGGITPRKGGETPCRKEASLSPLCPLSRALLSLSTHARPHEKRGTPTHLAVAAPRGVELDLRRDVWGRKGGRRLGEGEREARTPHHHHRNFRRAACPRNAPTLDPERGAWLDEGLARPARALRPAERAAARERGGGQRAGWGQKERGVVAFKTQAPGRTKAYLLLPTTSVQFLSPITTTSFSDGSPPPEESPSSSSSYSSSAASSARATIGAASRTPASKSASSTLRDMAVVVFVCLWVCGCVLLGMEKKRKRRKRDRVAGAAARFEAAAGSAAAAAGKWTGRR